MNAWFEALLLAFTAVTVLLQVYVLWLVVNRSPKVMHPFRFTVFLFTFSDLLFTTLLGFVANPDLLVPDIAGCTLNGLALFFGPNAGQITFALLLYSAPCMIASQVYAFMFRYTAIQKRFPDLHAIFNRNIVRAVICSIGQVCSVTIAYGASGIAVSFTEIAQVLRNEYPPDKEAVQKLIAKTPSNLLLIKMYGPEAQLFVLLVGGGLLMAFVVNVLCSWLIFYTLRNNAHLFSASTYRMHQQLTILIITQFCLPIAFIVFPLAVSTFVILYQVQICKMLGDIVLLFLSLYPFINTLLTLYFVAPFRKHALAKFEKLLIPFRGQNAVQPQLAQSVQRIPSIQINTEVYQAIRMTNTSL